MSYNFAFFVSDKPRTVSLGNALAQGAKQHGDRVTLLSQSKYDRLPDEFDGGAVLGQAKFSKRLLADCRERDKRYMIFDKGYMARNQYLRVSLDSWQPLKYFQWYMHPFDRLERIMSSTEFQVRPRQVPSTEGHILLAGNCQSYANYHDLPDVTPYHQSIVDELRKRSQRRILYRPNPSWARKHKGEMKLEGAELSPPTRSFIDELYDCHLCVTPGSSAAFQALSRGVAIMVVEEGMGKNVGSGWDDIEDPYWPDDKVRRQFFADVAYCQWTHAEYSSGEAWKHLRLVMDGLSNKGSVAPRDVIDQYELMHRNPKYFRGRSVVKHADVIGELIEQTGSKRILDYGSGKGEQYNDPYSIQKQWDVRVVCYDPGVPEFARPPSKKADGVICCDVMEHVPEARVAWTLREILGLARHFAFFAIATSPAKKVLPDGRNCHLTVKPAAWWQKQLGEASVAFPDVQVKLVTASDDSDE